MEAVKEGRLIIVRVPLEGGGRLVVSVNDAEAKELHRDVPLIVEHGDDGIELACRGFDEDCVARERADHVEAAGTKVLDDRLVYTLVLVAEDAALAGMRIECRHSDARTGDAKIRQRLEGKVDDACDALARHQLRHVGERHMGRYVRHTEIAMRQHHAAVAARGESGQKIGMPGVAIAGEV